jgi:hypothetical protein
MLKLKKQPYNSVWISADTQKELGETFIRFQEYYESPSRKYRNQIFTLGDIKNYYSLQYGSDLYSDLWIGFNFPSSVLIPFKQGLFDPLTSQEKELLGSLKYRHDQFYIIGAQNNSTLRHELSHAMYGYDTRYKNEIDSYIQKNKKGFTKVYKHILKRGYDKSVLNDELQAYITDNDDEFIRNNLNPNLINGILSIYKRYRKHDRKLG